MSIEVVRLYDGNPFIPWNNFNHYFQEFFTANSTLPKPVFDITEI